MDLASDITRVHDVSREAELGTLLKQGLGSIQPEDAYFTISHDIVTAGAATVTEGVGVYANQAPGWSLNRWGPPDPLKETVWFLGASAVIEAAGDIASAEVLIERSPKAGAGSGVTPNRLVFLGTLRGLSDGVSRPIIPDARVVAPAHPLPILNKLLNNSPIWLSTATIAATVVDYHIECIRLPIGVLPPGLY